MFGTGRLHFNNVIQTPAQLEQTASENDQTTQSSEVLTEQSVYYARKLGKKASDAEYFKNRMISDDLMAVSYTHLDVYKRQGMYQSMKKTALFSYIKTNFLSGSNPQVLYLSLIHIS